MSGHIRVRVLSFLVITAVGLGPTHAPIYSWNTGS